MKFVQQQNFWVGPSSVSTLSSVCHLLSPIALQGFKTVGARPASVKTNKMLSCLVLQESLIHLGAKFSPCMRQDQEIHRLIQEKRVKERESGCCIRNDRSGCLQTSQEECSVSGAKARVLSRNPSFRAAAACV